MKFLVTIIMITLLCSCGKSKEGENKLEDNTSNLSTELTQEESRLIEKLRVKGFMSERSVLGEIIKLQNINENIIEKLDIYLQINCLKGECEITKKDNL